MPEPYHLPECLRTGLAEACASLQNGAQIAQAMSTLPRLLYDARRTLPMDEWSLARVACRDHPVGAYLYQDPLTFRCFQKPRGYPGDAEIIDLIYGSGKGCEALAATTAIGRKIYNYNFHTVA